MTTKLYAGIDLHSNNSYVVVLDENDKVVYQKRLSNDLAMTLEELSPYQELIEGIVVESTYNWYWLVDGLQKVGYQVYLANTTAIQQYSGLKYTDDKKDAVWLARLLRLRLLATGYIYPKEKRGVRELLRRRMVLVRQQTMCLLGIKNMMTRYENIKVTSDRIKQCAIDEEKMVKKILNDIEDDHVRLAIQSQLKILNCIMKEVEHCTRRQTAKSLYSSKYFGLEKGISALNMILNGLSVNTSVIGANEHESHYSFDLCYNNTSGVTPDILSTDTAGSNQVNFLLYDLIDIQYAPCYKSFQDRIKNLNGFKPLNHYKNMLIKPTKILNRQNIITECLICRKS